MIDLQAKRTFWAAVSDCLVEIFGFPRSRANRASSALRKKVERSTPSHHQDIFYHAEPIDIAQDIAGVRCDSHECRQKYDAILSRHDW
jgi:hypothetical protein